MKRQHGGSGRGQGRKPHPDKKVSKHRVMLRGAMWSALEQEAVKRGTTVNRVIEICIQQFLDTVMKNLSGLLEEDIPPSFDDVFKIVAQMYDDWARGNDVTNRVDELMEAYDKWLD